jgi:hypothetical protein
VIASTTRSGEVIFPRSRSTALSDFRGAERAEYFSISIVI